MLRQQRHEAMATLLLLKRKGTIDLPDASPAKVALVLGGTRGIGGGISRRMAADGYALAAVYRNRSNDAERLEADLEPIGTQPLIIQADVSDPAALFAAIDATVVRFGRIDVLVNSAGFAITGPLDSYR